MTYPTTIELPPNFSKEEESLRPSHHPRGGGPQVPLIRSRVIPKYVTKVRLTEAVMHRYLTTA